MEKLPTYQIEHFKNIHRNTTSEDNFGYAQLSERLKVKGFALFSTKGAKEVISPTKSDFYRVSLCLQGSAKVNLDLESFEHQKGTVSFTFPKQLFSKESQSPDFFGYYLFFTEAFLSDWISASNFVLEYPFFSYLGQAFFQLNDSELAEVKVIIEQINQELQTENIERKKAIQLYLQLLFTYLKRSYTRQDFEENTEKTSQQAIVFRFKKLVSEHFLTYRNVSDYAEMLAITPNYLNRIVKQETHATASYFINQMLLTEARALLKHSEMSISEIAFHLSFSDVAHFSNFFKQHLNISPTQYKK